MPTIEDRRKVTVKLKTITGLQLNEWRVYTLRLTQGDLAAWMGRSSSHILKYEAAHDEEIPRHVYLACLGLAAELRTRPPKPS